MRIGLLLFVALFPCFLHAQSQTEMNMQSRKDYEAVDKRLNATYQKVLASLDEAGKAKLRDSERAWIAYRDAEAAFESDAQARGGTMAPLIYNTCAASLTEKRIKQLTSAIVSN